MRPSLVAIAAALCLLGAAPAHAALPPPTLNLLKNGDFELGSAATYGNESVCPADWGPCTNNGTSVFYGSPTFPTPAESDRIGGGRTFFAGGPKAKGASIQQYVDVTFAAAEIDGMGAVATISGCLGGWTTDDDVASVRLETFPPGTAIPTSTTTKVGPDATARGAQTKLVRAWTPAGVPYGTRLLRFTVIGNRDSDAAVAYNDAYADNVMLTLGTNAARGAAATCTGSTAGGGGGGGGGGGDGRGGPDDATVPAKGATLTRLGLSATRFRAAGSGPAASRRRRTPVGTRVSYVVDRAAPVTFTVTRRAAGVRKGRRCVRPGRRAGKGRRCTRTVTAASFRRASVAGNNRFRFTGRARGRKLAPGRYRLNASSGAAPRSVAFRVVR